MDTGTMDSLFAASDFVHMIQTQQGMKIAALEEIGYRNHWIDREELMKSAERYGKSSYGKHLRRVAEGRTMR